MKAVRILPKQLLLAVMFVALVVAPKLAFAHAVLVASTPAANTTVKGPEIAIHLKFNSRIDGERSRLYLVNSSGKSQMLTLTPQDAPDTLGAKSMKLNAGAYTIRWQALAADGHITRGEIPFTVE
jgi:hypothetical protein